VPHAGTSGHDLDYMKPRRVLCDLLSHLYARDGRYEHMSTGLSPIAEIARRGQHGRKVPEPGSCTAAK
jgi:hypothetical protein